jgi:hypothetical protein
MELRKRQTFKLQRGNPRDAVLYSRDQKLLHIDVYFTVRNEGSAFQKEISTSWINSGHVENSTAIHTTSNYFLM